ncbi:MAG: hypothetical protein AAB497_03855 [Patescibacteria group bacterium]
MKKIIALGVSFMPFIVSAQTLGVTGAGTSLDTSITWLKAAMNMGISLMIGAAVLYVVYSAFGFVMAAGDEEARAEKRSGIIYGVIGVAVMVSVYGLVNFLTGSIGVTATPITAPVAF